jgi:immunity protein 42 of polymorphic toxin system
MIVGNPSIFAIESQITKAYESLSMRALGFFVVHIGGRS